MSIVNDALLATLPNLGVFLYDDLAAKGTTAATAQILRGQANRFISAVASGAAVLPSLAVIDAPPFMFVINDSTVALTVFPAGTETIMGVNASQSVPAGQAAFLLAVYPMRLAKGGGQPPASIKNDWRFTAIS
jgi:hypothetical protein